MSKKALLILLMLTAVMIFASCGRAQEPVEVTDTAPPFDAAPLHASNVAREGYAVGSTSKYDGGFSNLYLNDGDLNRGFSTGWDEIYDPAVPQYVLIDLAGVYTVEAVKLYPLKGEEEGFPIDFDILISRDNETFTRVASVDGADAATAKGGLTVSFDPAQAAYVKLLTRKTGIGAEDRGAYIALAEFEVIAAIDTGSNMMLNRSDIWLFLDPDTTQQLKVTYYRDGTSVKKRKQLNFYSDDPSVASVNTDGLISPVAPGETVIYVYDGTDRAACHVTVKTEPANDFRVTAFYHSSFGSPETYVKGLQILKDAGIEYIEDTRFFDKVGNNITMYMIYLCNKLGLSYSVCDQEGGEGGYLKMSDDEIIACVQKYENRAGLYGIYLRDEPHEEYTRYARVHRLIQEYNPHLIPHLNLLPPFNFGGTEEYFTEYAAVAGGARRMQFLSFDFYPFRWNGAFTSTFYSAADMVRDAGVKYNADTGYYMQSMIITNAYPLLYEKELRYNASLGLAYGMKNFKWFVALTPIGSGEAFETGLVGPDFEPADNYEDIIKANRLIKNMGPYLANYDAAEVYHTNKESGALTVPDTFLIRPEDKKQAIFTLFTANDGSSSQRILITNKNYQRKTALDYGFTLTKELGELKMYDPLTGQESVLTPENGVYTVSLEPGSCVLLLLPEGTDAAKPEEESADLALNKGVFVSSSQAEFWNKGIIGTHFLTDGDPESGYWISGADDKQAELMLDLGKSVSFSRIQVYGHRALGEHFCSRFTVSVSEDGVNYTQVASMNSASVPDASAPCVVSFSPVNARYILFRLLDNSPSGGTGFGEIEVYAS